MDSSLAPAAASLDQGSRQLIFDAFRRHISRHRPDRWLPVSELLSPTLDQASFAEGMWRAPKANHLLKKISKNSAVYILYDGDYNEHLRSSGQLLLRARFGRNQYLGVPSINQADISSPDEYIVALAKNAPAFPKQTTPNHVTRTITSAVARDCEAAFVSLFGMDRSPSEEVRREQRSSRKKESRPSAPSDACVARRPGHYKYFFPNDDCSAGFSSSSESENEGDEEWLLPPSTYASGAEVLDEIKFQYNVLICNEKCTIRRRLLVFLRDIFHVFVFENMSPGIKGKVGYQQYVGEKGGFYEIWEEYRNSVLFVFQGLEMVYVAFSLYYQPHYQLKHDLIVQYIDEAISRGYRVVRADEAVPDDVKSIKIAFPTSNYFLPEEAYVVHCPDAAIFKHMSMFPFRDMAKCIMSHKGNRKVVKTDRGNIQANVVHSGQNQRDQSALAGCNLPKITLGASLIVHYLFNCFACLLDDVY